MIAIIDYGLGNIQAFVNIYKRLHIPVSIAGSVEDLACADKIILPGVGSFDWAMTKLNDSGMCACLDDLVLNKGCPVLGICVGMQMMAKHSEEGDLPGLGWLDAEVKKFSNTSPKGNRMILPHMGWNNVKPGKTNCLFKDMAEDARFYFLHSYYFLPAREDNVLAVTEYDGFLFASSVRTENIFGVQFHPEKSHRWGINLLKNFAEL